MDFWIEKIKKEEYEKIDRVQKWIEDLIKYYHLD